MNKYIIKIDGGLEFHFQHFKDCMKMAEDYLKDGCSVEVYMLVWQNGELLNGKK